MQLAGESLSSLKLRLVSWNEAANPTRTRVTAVAAYRDGVACGYADGTIWLYDIVMPAATKAATAIDTDRGQNDFELYPKCLLSAHQSSITLIKLAELSSPSPEGYEDTLISVSDDGDIIVWSAVDGRCISRVWTPLPNIRPVSMCLQTMDYQSAAEDLLFITGEGSAAYILSYPSLAVVYEWQLPHAEWITAHAVRKRKDHFRSELLTCTADGVVRIWSYDEFALAQQDVFSRAASPTAQQPRIETIAQSIDKADVSILESIAGSEAELHHSQFNLESQFAALGPDQVISELVINPFNDDEFLAVSPAIVRLFASRNNELHELLRWRPQRATPSSFVGAGFLGKADILFWDMTGTIFSVCTQFSIEGGSAGIHMARGWHSDNAGLFSVATGLCSVPPGTPDSALSRLTGKQNMQTNVLVSYSSSTNAHVLSVVLPVPLSSVSGSANRPHENPEDAKSGHRNWLGRTMPFDLSMLWDRWLQDVKPETPITSALVLCGDRIAIGRGNGAVQIVSRAQLIRDRDAKVNVLDGHNAAITAFYEWQPAVAHKIAHQSERTAERADTAYIAGDQSTHSLLLSASKDLTLRFWDTLSGECLYALPTQSAPVVHMACMLESGKQILWKDSVKHQVLNRLLSSLVLAVASDNSTTLVSVSSFERIHVTAPYHMRPVCLSLCRDSGDLALHYTDGTKRYIPLSHLRGTAGDQMVPDKSERYPEISVNLIRSKPNNSSWLKASVLSQKMPALVLDVDIEQLQATFSRILTEQMTQAQMEQLVQSNPTLQAAVAVLSQLCLWGVSEELDKIKREFGMGMPRPMSLSMSNRQMAVHTLLFPNMNNASASWCMSSLLNSQRMLAVLMLARSILQGNEKKAVQMINFYVGKLPGQIGRQFKPLSLLTLAQYWQSTNGNLQRAARTLMLSAVHGVSEKQRRAELFYWTSMLARCGPKAVDGEDLQALTIVCVVAGDFPALLPLTGRSMVATLLQTQLEAEGVGAQLAAMELLSRGFSTFRAYLDCQAVVQRLVEIMVSITEEAGEGSGGVSYAAVGQAKAALQRISAADADVVGAGLERMLREGSLEEQRRALQAVGVVVQKQAGQLQGRVEGLAEAIVGTLEPKRATARRRLIGAAGVALQGLVRAFSWVSFDAEAQLLAVGGASGRCVVYDVRTATRTAVFDGDGTAPVVAVAIAPAGDYVASFTLAGQLSVWDPQPSALAMFTKALLWSDMQAAAHGSVTPLKTMTIPRGFLGHAEVPASALMRVARLQWTGSKTVLLQIQDASFSLSI
ncbi:hypothetical protein IWW36_000286 [Coemansia brasiliensis]|uniref:WD40 repeat-like protein n=1 Tax=Coemansia brasiliensis TaxID=2650707 RepID=A0A9W8IIX7_9FUNG|nr:hypothetical protein IWW36_000286 [Coemansia brasiliensis]